VVQRRAAERPRGLELAVRPWHGVVQAEHLADPVAQPAVVGVEAREAAYVDYRRAIAWEERNLTALIQAARRGVPFVPRSDKPAPRARTLPVIGASIGSFGR